MVMRLSVRTSRRAELVDITEQVAAEVRSAGFTEGLVLAYCPHTTCGLTIQENADPGVRHDMLLLLDRLAPRDDPDYRHIEDNSASHLQASMMGFSETVMVDGGRMVLGRWQALYLCEFDGPRERTVLVKLCPDK